MDRWEKLTSGEAPPNRAEWPYTDNGSMLEAILEMEEKAGHTECATGACMRGSVVMDREHHLPTHHAHTDHIAN
jgi:hypothetical protein